MKNPAEIRLFLGRCKQAPIPEAAATTPTTDDAPTALRQWSVRVADLDDLLTLIAKHGPLLLSLDRSGTTRHPTLEWTGTFEPHEDCDR